MELSASQQADIVEIFRQVNYGEITFQLNPDKEDMTYYIRISGKLKNESKPKKIKIHLTK